MSRAYRVAAVLASLIQSNGITSQLMSARPCLRASASTSSFTRPPAVRSSVGRCPSPTPIAALARLSWAGTSRGGIVVMLGVPRCGCRSPYRPRRSGGTRGIGRHLVADQEERRLASLSCRIFSSRSVYGPGPSSNVSATHLTFAQSTSASSVCFAWPGASTEHQGRHEQGDEPEMHLAAYRPTRRQR